MTALLPLWRKWCSGFLSPLKIHRPRSGSNPRTLGPVASTLTTSPPRSTKASYRSSKHSFVALCYIISNIQHVLATRSHHQVSIIKRLGGNSSCVNMKPVLRTKYKCLHINHFLYVLLLLIPNDAPFQPTMLVCLKKYKKDLQTSVVIDGLCNVSQLDIKK
jgi:hypothetical protein